MQDTTRPIAFWFIIVFLTLSILVLLLGQSLALVNYDFTVRLGLQESVQQVGLYGVNVNRAFGAGDTLIYIPLMVASIAGLLLKKRWSLLTTAAAAGVSAYWSVTIGIMLMLLPGVPGYTLAAGLEYWLFLGAYFGFGTWCLIYLAVRGDQLLTWKD